MIRRFALILLGFGLLSTPAHSQAPSGFVYNISTFAGTGEVGLLSTQCLYHQFIAGSAQAAKIHRPSKGSYTSFGSNAPIEVENGPTAAQKACSDTVLIVVPQRLWILTWLLSVTIR